MNIVQTLQEKKIKRGKLFAGGLAAGLLTMGMGGAVGASGYGGYGGYSGNNYNSNYGSNYNNSASYEQSSYYKSSESSYNRNTCSYAAQWRYNSGGGYWDWMYYDYNSGIWYSCSYESSYKKDVEASNYVKANYNNSYNNYNNYNSNYNNRYW